MYKHSLSLLVISFIIAFTAIAGEPQGDVLIASAWTSGINPVTGKTANVLFTHPYLIAPRSIVQVSDGKYKISYDETPAFHVGDSIPAIKLGTSAVDLVKCAIANHYWINVELDPRATTSDNMIKAMLLEPYDYESAYSVADIRPSEGDLKLWKNGFKSCDSRADTASLEKAKNQIVLLKVMKDRVVFLTTGDVYTSTGDGSKETFQKNPPADEVNMLKFAMKQGENVYISFDRNTHEIYAMQFDPAYTSTIIIGD